MKKLIAYAALISVPLVAVIGAAFANGTNWELACAAAAVLCCVPFFLSFEGRAPSARELVLTAVMTAFSAAGRFVFAWLPFFKPVTAIVVISAMYMGPTAGFLIGALSALISNIYFGQGIWTPFQMFSWGIIGFAAGLLNKKKILENPVALSVYGALSGVVYSVLMDIFTVLSADGSFSPERWAAAVAASLPIMAVYCISNVLFVLILRKPLGKRMERIRTKYGVFEGSSQKNHRDKPKGLENGTEK
ncbi:MAG: ECF transporter S component [Oscillospiraceae bacterium]